jgi:hypothetical protein
VEDAMIKKVSYLQTRKQPITNDEKGRSNQKNEPLQIYAAASLSPFTTFIDRMFQDSSRFGGNNIMSL